jgi:hypothetical protein
MIKKLRWAFVFTLASLAFVTLTSQTEEGDEEARKRELKIEICTYYTWEPRPGGGMEPVPHTGLEKICRPTVEDLRCRNSDQVPCGPNTF